MDAANRGGLFSGPVKRRIPRKCSFQSFFRNSARDDIELEPDRAEHFNAPR